MDWFQSIQQKTVFDSFWLIPIFCVLQDNRMTFQSEFHLASSSLSTIQKTLNSFNVWALCIFERMSRERQVVDESILVASQSARDRSQQAQTSKLKTSRELRMLSGVTLNCHNGCHEFRFPIRQNCNQCVCHYQAQCRVHIHTVTQCWVGLALSTNQEGGEGVSILGLGRNVVISFRSHNSLWNCCVHVIQMYLQKARKSLLFR